MKVTIDTKRKVIEIDESINIEELIEELKALLGKEWKEYSIEQKIEGPYYPIYPYYPTFPITYPIYPITYTTGLDNE